MMIQLTPTTNANKTSRTVLALFLQDAEIATLFHHEPLMRQAPNRLPEISSNDAFSAPNSRAWKSIMISQAEGEHHNATHMESSESANLLPFSSSTAIFGLQVTLARIGVLVKESHGDFPSMSLSSHHYQDLLMEWHSQYQRNIAFRDQKPGLMMLWHSVFMTCYMDVDKLERFCGRDGLEAQRSLQEDVHKWARSDDAKRCIIHAILAQRDYEKIPVGEEPPIHFPQCLYRCGIAWYCYCAIRDKSSRQAREELDLPELRALGMNSTKVLSEEADLIDGRPAGSPLFRIIHLLQCASHRKIAHNLASTLTAIVDAGQGTF